MTAAPSRNFPFGREGVDTLIVCKNQDHIRVVSEAFGTKAMYTTWGNALTAYRFKKIIVFRADMTESRVLEENQNRWFRESVVTCLKPDGDLYLV